MRKLVCMGLSLIMLFLLSACMESEPTKEINSDSQISSESKGTSEDTFVLNETAVFEELKITATEIKETTGKDFFEPEEGAVFVGVNFTIENISSETQAISSLLLFEAYADDIKCDYSFNAACAFDEGTLDGELAAGKKMVGWYAVEVPADWSTIEFDVASSWLSSNSAKFVFENK